MCECCKNFKIFMIGAMMGFAGGAIYVGLSKKAQKTINKGKELAEDAIEDIKQKAKAKKQVAQMMEEDE